MHFTLTKTLWKENKGFKLDRPCITEYIFVHFLTPVTGFLKGKRIDIEPGGCVIWEKGAHQKFSSPDCELIHDWFHAEDDCGELMKKYNIKDETVYYPRFSKEITQLIAEIELESIKKETMYKEICSADGEKLFAYLARSIHDKNGTVKDLKQKKTYINARNKIHSDYMHDWSVGEMAALVNTSESRFYCVYKEIFGISPGRDLRNSRLERAKLLLIRDGYSVEEAGELSGFGNQYHFIRQFKQYFGMTPGKLRNKNN